jgi:hypothetical protein
MSIKYTCQNESRRKLVRGSQSMNGIDYLEVFSTTINGVVNTTLNVFLLNTSPELPPGSVIYIEGGARYNNISVEGFTQINDTDNKPTNQIKIKMTGPFDLSKYTLRIVGSATTNLPPAGFDSQLSSIEFSFNVLCPSDFDCSENVECPPEILLEPELDYLAKDYASFRRLMLDRLSLIMPQWRERNPADLQMALVEILAYVGDHLSYYQDAVATEAYLGTARRRVSVRRHARLLDYKMHDGCNARTWVCLESTSKDPIILPTGTLIQTQGNVSSNSKKRVQPTTFFETMHELKIRQARNLIKFYTWGNEDCCLPAGSTRATLLGKLEDLALRPGDVLIFEEIISPITGLRADADPLKRWAVRLTNIAPNKDVLLNNTALVEIEWHEDDALPFSFCLNARVNNGQGPDVLVDVSIVRGNVVLADHGRTLRNQPPIPDSPDINSPTRRYRPRLNHTDITFAEIYDHDQTLRQAASSILRQDPARSLPSGPGDDRQQPLTLWDGDEYWTAQRELLASDRFQADFVAEVERDGIVYLRFGDGVLGKPPAAGSTFTANYRIGNGQIGNIGAETLTRLVEHVDGISSVRNPMPAVGGVEAETMEEVRLYAPQAFRVQDRAVTEADYAEVTERHPEVQKAAARFRWTGSWYTVFITIDRKGGLPIKADVEFQQEIRRHVDRYRLAGYDIQFNEPNYVPLKIKLQVCAKPGYFRGNIKKNLTRVFSNQILSADQRGFFHPDNFTFGQPLYLSRIYQAALDLPGIDSVKVIEFRRLRETAGDEIQAGVLAVQDMEIIQLDNDPNFPENGRIEFDVQGGI